MNPINLDGYEALARERLPPMVFDYYFGGADDELTKFLTAQLDPYQQPPIVASAVPPDAATREQPPK